MAFVSKSLFFIRTTFLVAQSVRHNWAPKHTPGISADKESAFNAGDPSSIPGSGRFPGEGIGYPLQYSLASLVAQRVKKLPVMRETWGQSLGWEDPLEEGMAIHSSIPAWRIPMDRGAWWDAVHGVANSQTWLSTHTHTNWTLRNKKYFHCPCVFFLLCIRFSQFCQFSY